MAGLFQLLIGGPLSQKSAYLDEGGAWAALWGRPAKSGVSVTFDTALQCTTALACVQALACGVAMLPLDLYKKRTDGGRDVASDHPSLSRIGDQPNEWQTWVEWIETTMMHAVLCGDGISFINRPDAGGPIRELIPLVPGQVTVEQRDDYTLEYRVMFKDGRYVVLPRSSVFHLRAPSWNTYGGLDATRLAREAIGLALATEETHARLHGNGARPSGFLTTDATTKIDKPAIDALRESWQQAQGGLENVGKTAILTGGLKWVPTAMNGVDSQHIETRRFQIEEICRALGLFPAAIGHSDKTSTFASAEQFFLAHVVYSLGRWTRRFEERLRIDLLTPAERREKLYWKFSLQALLRGDAKSRAEFYRALIELGVMTRNEARGLEDLNPIEGLSVPLRPLNMDAGAGKVPPGQAKAIAAAVKAMIGHNGGPELDDAELEIKVGRVLSATNERRVVSARDSLNMVLATLSAEDGGDDGAA